MKFDSNLAWKEASMAVQANRDVLLALAGVFFLLPSLAFALLVKQPDVQTTMGASGAAGMEAAMAQLQAFYVRVLPWMIAMVLIQAIGTLAMMGLFTDRTRPTVGQAIGQGVKGILPYLAAQILFGMAVGLIGSVLIGIAAVTGVKALVAIMVIAVIVGVIYAAVKVSLVAPVVVVDQIRNPVAALARSWRLTKGNSVRIAVFFVLVGIVFLVLLLMVSAVFGLLVAMLAGPATQVVIQSIVSAVLGALMSVYFVAILAAIHRQLSGPSSEAITKAFE